MKSKYDNWLINLFKKDKYYLIENGLISFIKDKDKKEEININDIKYVGDNANGIYLS
jgi:sulfur transfer complex TusBCD TusB component (DsrH family)